MRDRAIVKPSVIGKYDISLDGKSISYTLKRSSKARLIWLKIYRETGLTVTVPRHYDIKLLPEYLRSRSKWILRNLTSPYRGEPASSTESNALPPNTISYLGEHFRVTKNINDSGAAAIKLEQIGGDMGANTSAGNLSQAELEQWMKDQAARLINDKVKLFSQHMELIYNRVTIRSQKSRWASCSVRKNLNFNWKLIMAPEQVLDYVIIHELCHLKELSHSKAFWNLVSQYCPNWREHRTWLNRHCTELNVNLQ